MSRRKSPVLPSYDPNIVRLLKLRKRTRPTTVRRILKAVFRTRCKPCWELKYCPYGPLVEQFPLPRIIRADAIRHNEFLKQRLKTGAYDAPHKRMFSAEVKNFNPRNFPEQTPEEEDFMRCHIFGHYCPVFFVGEPFTETGDLRKGDSSISFQTKLRVARRDNYTCQECGRLLREFELEFDHIIPRALGGTSDEHNIRLTCLKCNRKKGKHVEL
jgi:hypothetical protein